MGSQRGGHNLATEQHNILMISKWKNPGACLLLPSCLLQGGPAVGPGAAASAQPGLLGRWAAALPPVHTPPPFSLPSQRSSQQCPPALSSPSELQAQWCSSDPTPSPPLPVSSLNPKMPMGTHRAELGPAGGKRDPWKTDC